jgi:hypothetical protein
MRNSLIRKHGFHGMLSFIVALFLLLGFHGNSIAQCKADVDCKGNRICKDGQCVEPVQPQPTLQATPVKGCRADIDCPGNQICQNGTCVDKTVSPSPVQTAGGCGKDSDCKGNRVCINGQCVDGGAAASGTMPVNTGVNSQNTIVNVSINGEKTDAQQQQATNAEAPSHPSVLGKVGLGFGIPYGWIGAGFEFGTQYVSVVGGIGSTIIISGVGWSVGGRGYFLNSTHKFRPHVTVLYGPTVVYDIQVIPIFKKVGTLSGVSVYLGGDHDVGKIGGFVFTYALGFITHSDFPKDVQDAVHATGSNLPSFGSPVKVCVGFNYRIGG